MGRKCEPVEPIVHFLGINTTIKKLEREEIKAKIA